MFTASRDPKYNDDIALIKWTPLNNEIKKQEDLMMKI